MLFVVLIGFPALHFNSTFTSLSAIVALLPWCLRWSDDYPPASTICLTMANRSRSVALTQHLCHGAPRMPSISYKWTFGVGVAVGIILASAAFAAFFYWPAQRSERDAALYDGCLIQRAGNTVACDAMMRDFARHDVFMAKMNKDAAKLRAAGASKRDIIHWAQENGLVGSEISDAAGISLQDLWSNNY